MLLPEFGHDGLNLGHVAAAAQGGLCARATVDLQRP
jgi:hypothetical protein